MLPGIICQVEQVGRQMSLGRREHSYNIVGFSLLELMVAVGSLAIGLIGLLATFVNVITINETSRDMNLVINSLQAQCETLKNTDFDELPSYNTTTFDIPGFSSNRAKGRIEVTPTVYSDLLKARLVASYKLKDARVIGEDKNLNGILNSGEDANGNGNLDSPAELVTLIARME